MTILIKERLLNCTLNYLSYFSKSKIPPIDMDILAQAAGSVGAPAALGGAALALATAAYANAKFGIKADIDSLRDEAALGKLLGQRIAELGDTCTLYGMLRRAIEVDNKGSAEALWFEKKSWTYDQLRDCKCFCPSIMNCIVTYMRNSGRSSGGIHSCPGYQNR